MPERATVSSRSEKSAEVVVAVGRLQSRPEAKGRTRRSVRIPMVRADVRCPHPGRSGEAAR